MHPINRKEMLCEFFRNELSDSDIKYLQTQLPQHYHLIYTLFNILRDNDAVAEDIVDAKIVDGDVKLNLSSKAIAKAVEKEKDEFSFGGRKYKLKIRRSGSVVVATAKLIED